MTHFLMLLSLTKQDKGKTQIMQLKALQKRIHEHAERAYAFLPGEAVYSHPPFSRKNIEQKLVEGDWRQVTMMLESLSRKNDFPPELLYELSLARQAMNDHYLLVAKEMMQRTTSKDKRVIGECLRGLVYGPFIDDDELHTVTGLNREELALVARAWPNINMQQSGWTPTYELPDFISLSVYAVGQTLGNLLGYPHRKENVWLQYIPTPLEEVKNVQDNWFSLIKQITNS